MFRFCLFIAFLFCLAESKNIDSAFIAEPMLESIALTQEWKALLHYQNNKSRINKKSTFFLDKYGYKNPLRELEKTYNAFIAELDSSIDSSESKICRYPARANFISKNIDDYKLKTKIESRLATCKDLNEFLIIVPIDELYIEFAAESDFYPGSSMGHIYLKAQGVAKQDFYKYINENLIIEFKKGELREYALSYIANMDDLNPLSYISAIIGNLAGAYTLSPYENVRFDYIENEKRSIYRYRLNLAHTEIYSFALHLWELKDVNIHYAFITHNCTDALEGIVAVLDQSFVVKKHKPYLTPSEYISKLFKMNKITQIDTLIPESKLPFIKVFGENNVLDSAPSSRVRFSYVSKNELSFYFAPIYSDLTNANSAYKEFSESRLISIETKVNATSGKVWIERIEALKLFSIQDIFRTKNLSKYMSLNFENNVFNLDSSGRFRSEANDKNRILPSIEIGIGLGAYLTKGFAVYSVPILGYRYDSLHNGFVGLKSGLVVQMWRFRIFGEWGVYYDLIANNRGYDNVGRLNLAINLYKNVDLFLQYQGYFNFFALESSGGFISQGAFNYSLFYESNKLNRFIAGISFNF